MAEIDSQRPQQEEGGELVEGELGSRPKTFGRQSGHSGRASSWLAVTVMLLGFTVGGVALCLGPHWFAFWLGAGIFVLGGVLALVFDVFSDVVVDTPRVMFDEEGRPHDLVDRT
ncbi:hypothetical protein Misp01_04530 [Microtetraspora sp. NBRC 13810]|uniref:HGxxPAAW family protein n=1 Tax=Microtetraspora sp. NBRC 13810 TaxID=3030990 RepID=UPI0024A106E6|nr:HGxxPAAW family protein [Microtetraspora sp. NBRC 13810]GLW05323.1 hypothetical protein Misp01_04530 [Microtetraspora sp. NBRC 13810]